MTARHVIEHALVVYFDGNADLVSQLLTMYDNERPTGITSTPELENAYLAAEQAHADLYDEGSDDWRQGPGPIRLADFFVALSATGALDPLKL